MLNRLQLLALLARLSLTKSFLSEDDASLAVNICLAIGTALEQECQMRHYEREVPGLLNAIKKELLAQVMWYATEVRNRTYHDEPQRCSLEYVEQCQSCQAWRLVT